MFGEPRSTTLTLVALGAGLLLYLPARPPTAPEQPPRSTAQHQLLNCTSLEEVTDLEWVASGWTKAVYRGRLRGRDIAVKTVNLDGHDIESCLARPEAPSLARCYRRTSAKILRELILLQELDHPNVIKVLGSCIPDAVGPVVIATELGEPLDSVALLQLSWEERLKVALSVASLLHLLAHSPLGSLAAPDLKRQQFVLVDGQLKLTDADDLRISEPRCDTHADCVSHTGSDDNRVFCTGGRCRGHNERANILRAGEDLVRHVLPSTGPEGLEPQVRSILAAYRGDNSWDSGRILQETEALQSVMILKNRSDKSEPNMLLEQSHPVIVPRVTKPIPNNRTMEELNVTSSRRILISAAKAGLMKRRRGCFSSRTGHVTTFQGATSSARKLIPLEDNRHNSFKSCYVAPSRSKSKSRTSLVKHFVNAVSSSALLLTPPPFNHHLLHNYQQFLTRIMIFAKYARK